jgi:hypothetical protein
MFPPSEPEPASLASMPPSPLEPESVPLSEPELAPSPLSDFEPASTPPSEAGPVFASPSEVALEPPPSEEGADSPILDPHPTSVETRAASARRDRV